jgi:hypothetical protein
MIKKLILAVALLVAAAVPAQAWDGHRDWQRHDGPRRIEHWQGGHGHVAYPFYYRRVPQCLWQGGYWASQPILGAAGVYYYQSVWVPAQYVCY